MKRVLVTGGAGFIGSLLCERLLNNNNKVICLDDLSNSSFDNIRHLYNKKNFLFIKRDVRDDLISLKPDVIFHLAAQISVDKSIYEPKDTISRNVNGTMNVLETARICNSNLVYASSCEVYGNAETIPQNENHPTNPTSPYAVSKLAADKLCTTYRKIFDMPITILRCFNIYGPKQSFTSYGGVIAKFTHRVLNSKSPIIYGSGKQSRDYTNVSDAVNAYILAMNSEYYGILNISSGKEVRISDLAKKIIKYYDSNIEPIYVEPRPNDIMRSCGDSSLAKKVLKWKPKIDFDTGLANYIEWFEERGDVR